MRAPGAAVPGEAPIERGTAGLVERSRDGEGHDFPVGALVDLQVRAHATKGTPGGIGFDTCLHESRGMDTRSVT